MCKLCPSDADAGSWRPGGVAHLVGIVAQQRGQQRQEEGLRRRAHVVAQGDEGQHGALTHQRRPRVPPGCCDALQQTRPLPRPPRVRRETAARLTGSSLFFFVFHHRMAEQR